MDKRGHDFSQVAYVLGVISIVMAFFVPIAGIVLGIVGIVYSKKQKSELSDRAKRLSTIGLIIAIIMFAINILLTVYLGVLSPQKLLG